MDSHTSSCKNDLQLAISLQLEDFGTSDSSSNYSSDDLSSTLTNMSTATHRTPLHRTPPARREGRARRRSRRRARRREERRARRREERRAECSMGPGLSDRELSISEDGAFALQLAMRDMCSMRPPTSGAGPSSRPTPASSRQLTGAASSKPDPRMPSAAGAQPIACSICLELHPPSEQFPPAECGHSFCKTCMRRHLAVIAKEKRPLPIACPACPGEHPSVLDPQTCARELAGTGETYDAFERLLLQQQHVQRLSYCANKACSVPFDFHEIPGLDGTPHVTSTKVSCPLCGTDTCVACKVEWHRGRSCAEFRDENNGDSLLRKLAERKRWRACPKCKALIEKSQGCNHMECRCGFSFCYGCGRETCTCQNSWARD